MTNHDDEIDLKAYIEIIVKNGRLIIGSALLMSLLFLVYNLMQAPSYEAKTTIFVRNNGSSTSGQIAGLANVMGMNLSNTGGGIDDLSSLLKSQLVAAKVMDDLDLVNKVKGWNDPKLSRQELVKSVSTMLKLVKIQGNILEIITETSDPQISADVANAYVVALGLSWNQLNQSEAQKKLDYIENELPKVEIKLNQIAAKLRLGAFSSSGVPAEGSGGVQRDFEIYNGLYTMLRKENESTKLAAAKESLPFSVIDRAEIPKHKSKPNIKINALRGLIIGIFTGIFCAFIREYLRVSFCNA